MTIDSRSAPKSNGGVSDNTHALKTVAAVGAGIIQVGKNRKFTDCFETSTVLVKTSDTVTRVGSTVAGTTEFMKVVAHTHNMDAESLPATVARTSL